MGFFMGLFSSVQRDVKQKLIKLREDIIMSNNKTATTMINFGGLYVAALTGGNETAQHIMTFGNEIRINDKHHCEAQHRLLLREALKGIPMGDVTIEKFESEYKLYEINSVEEWTAFIKLSTEVFGYTRRNQVYTHLLKEGYYGISFSDEVAKSLTKMEQPSIVRCTKPYGHVMFLGAPNKLGSFTVVGDATNESRKSYEKYLAYADTVSTTKAKKDQCTIKQVNMGQVSFNPATGKCGVLPSVEITEVGTSSSVMFEMAKAEGIEIIVLDMAGDVKLGKENATAKERESVRNYYLNQIIYNGLWVAGLTYLPLLQSASQSRTGKVYMASASHEEIEKFRDKLSYGAFVCKKGTKQNMAKLEARFALASTNTYSVGYHEVDYGRIQDDVILDVEYSAKGISEIRDAEGNVVEYVIVDKIVKKNNATDGASWIHPLKAAEFARKGGYISQSDLQYFKSNYTSTDLDVMNANPRLKRIFSSIPKVFQVRCESIKGLLITYDFWNDRNGEFDGEMFVLHESMVKAKRSSDVEKAEWRISGVNNKKWGNVRLSTQFMTVLGMDLKDVEELVNESLSFIDKELLEDADLALKFVNAVGNVSEEKDSLDTKLASALAANPMLIKDRWVRNQLRKLVNKTVTQLKYGGVVVEGVYAYAIPDPRAFFRPESCLKSGQYYLNNMEQQIAFLRAPHIHHSESQVLDLVKDDELWYFENVVIFNPFDSTAQACQGMDFDGDQGLCTTDVRIIRNIEKEKAWLIEQGLGYDAEEAEFTLESRLQLYIRRSKRDNVGVLSNYALLFREYQLHLENLSKLEDTKEYAEYIEELEKKVIILACLIGAEIDYAKTGIRPTITDDLKASLFPAWWPHFKCEIKKESVVLENGKVLTGKEAIPYVREKIAENNGDNCFFGDDFTCLTPVGTCFKLVSEWQEKNSEDFEGEKGSQNLSTMIASLITPDRVTPLLGQVEHYATEYGRELARLSNTNFGDDELRKEVYAEFYDRQQALFDGISEDKVAVAAATYWVVNNKDGKGNSAPWTCCFDGLVALFSEGTNTMLYSLPSFVKEGDSIEADNGSLFINRRYHGDCSFPNGIYSVLMIQGRAYAKVKRQGTVSIKPKMVNGEIVPNRYAGQSLHKITMKGFGYHGETAQSVAHKLLNGSVEVRTGSDNLLYLYDGAKTLAVVAGELSDLMAVRNTRIKVLVDKIETTYTHKATKEERTRGTLTLDVCITGTTDETPVEITNSTYAEYSSAVDACDLFAFAPSADQMAFEYQEMMDCNYDNQYDVVMDFDIADFQ